MELINTILGTPLGYIIYFAYQLTGSYWLSVVVFAIIVRVVVLFPVSILAHKNSIRLLQISPRLNIIRKRYSGDKERLNEEQHELFKSEKYNPLVGVIPLVVQLILIIGIMQVMLNPMRHMHGIAEDSINFIFMGLDFRVIPSIFSPSPELIMLLLSGGSAFLFCLTTNALSPGALSQSDKTNNGMTIFTVALSLYLALVLPVGVAFYWTTSNFVAIGMVLLLNVMYNPKKLAPEALAATQAEKKSPEELKKERELNKKLKAREKQDAAKFREVKKELVFYAITGGQYKYYKTVIEYILENSETTIHYLTSDPDDSIFAQDNPRLIPYYAGQRKTISLMLKLDADMLVTTVPDLQSYHMKRSIVCDDIEYVYVFHAATSTHMIYREKAFDHFDTIFCVGPHHVGELRRREELAGLEKRKLIKAGYDLFDQLLLSYVPEAKNDKPVILIAPSWHSGNILETCIEDVLDALKRHGYEIIVRPHPQFTKLFRKRLDELEEKYAENTKQGEIIFELDFGKSSSIFESDLLITDWSAIAYEFTYSTSKPCVYINTPMKVMNPNWKKYGLEPMDIALRDKIGISIDTENIQTQLSDTVKKLLDEKETYKERIHEALSEYIYHPGRSAEAGGKYIIERLK
ncbi:MAG: membrane protein insertase YidC [Oscillospiraceae bacterium]|nr:membrane protein insertase YidC [Oscillospiraceae bacterium]